MKTLSHFALSATVAILLAQAALADSVKLTVWSDTARLEPFAAFDAAHDDIELDIVTVAPPDLVAKIQLVMRSGTDVPDAIFMAELTQVAQLSTRRSNYLMDLNGKVDKAIVDGFLPNANSPCVSDDGRLLCLRNDLAHMILWYNKPQMEENGLSVPTTWEEFEQVANAAAGKGLIVGTGVEPFPVVSMLVAGGCNVGFPVEGKINTIKVDVLNDGCRRAAGMIDRLRDNGALSPHGPFEPSFVTAVKDGRLLMILGPTWFGEHVIRPLYEMEPGVIAAALPPRWSDEAKPVTWSWGGGVYGGYRGSEHPEEVVRLLSWITSDVGLQTSATTMPAHSVGSASWGARVDSDPYYAMPNVYDVMLEAVAFSHPSYGGYRFDAMALFAKVDGASDAPLSEILDDYQEELVNNARVTDYDIVD